MEAESVPLIHLAPFFIMLSCYCEELYLTQSVIFFQAQTQTKIEPNCRLLGDSCNLRHWHPLLIPSLHSACNIATDCVKVGMLKDTFCVPQRCQQHWQRGSIWHSDQWHTEFSQTALGLSGYLWVVDILTKLLLWLLTQKAFWQHVPIIHLRHVFWNNMIHFLLLIFFAKF